MPAKVLFGLILCNFIWSANPAMGKLVLADFSPASAAWLRYASALVAYLVFYPVFRKRSEGRFLAAPSLGGRLRDLRLAALLGFMTFCYSPFAQLEGLSASRATDNALIVALEPLITVLLAWLILREKLSRIGVAAFALALLGFALLSGLIPGNPAEGWDAHRIGNVIILFSLLGEACYSVIGRVLLHRHDPVVIFGTALAFGVGFLTLGMILLPALHGSAMIDLAWIRELRFWEGGHWSWASALGVLWLGPLATTAAYLYWMSALSKAPVASLALTLFIQPVFGVLWGIVFLDERLSWSQSLGGLVILVAVAAPSVLHRATARDPLENAAH